MLIEDLCAHLTIATGRPVRFELTREQEFTSSRSRHPQILRYRSGVDENGKLVGMDLHVIADTGAYGTHGLTVQMVTGFRGLSTYWLPNARFDCRRGLHQQADAGRLPRLRRAAGAVWPRTAHGGVCAQAGSGPARVQTPQLGQGRPESAAGQGDGRRARGLCADRALQRPGRVRDGRQRRPPAGSAAAIPPGRATRSARTSSAASAWPSACTAPASPGWTWAPPASSSTTTAPSTCWSAPPTWAPAPIRCWPRSPPKRWACRSTRSLSTAATPISRPLTPAPTPPARPTSPAAPCSRRPRRCASRSSPMPPSTS